MEALSIEEMSSRLHPLTLEARVKSLRETLPEWGNGFAVPADSGKKTALARFVSSLFLVRPKSEAFIYISEWGVWPSAENLELFDSYRLAKGEARSLNDAPVHLFQAHDAACFVSILSLALYFVWDAEIFDSDGDNLVSISHDEWLEIRTNDTVVRQSCVEASDFGMLKALQSA